MKKQTKLCPLLDRKCLKKECSWHHELCDVCVLHLLAYNSYKLNLHWQQRPGDPTEEDED